MVRGHNLTYVQEHDSVLRQWETEKEDWLDELLRLEGLRGASLDECEGCHSRAEDSRPEYRCEDCFLPQFICRACCLAGHHSHPFHRIKVRALFPGRSPSATNLPSQKWNGAFFAPSTLQSAGLCLQLGHSANDPCTNPLYAPRASLVLHTNGFHPVTLLFCQCDRVHEAGKPTTQLLRAGLYAATITDPSTFCTIRMLDHFHKLTLQSKIAAYDWYESLARLTDNTGLSQHRVSTASVR